MAAVKEVDAQAAVVGMAEVVPAAVAREDLVAPEAIRAVVDALEVVHPEVAKPLAAAVPAKAAVVVDTLLVP